MPNLLYKMFGDPEPEPDEYVVRPHAEVVDVNKQPAEEERPPEWNAVTTDNDPNLGLAGRTLASDWTEGVHTPPVNMNTIGIQHNDIINRQVASSGHAASVEVSGTRGPGTLSYAVGIEPVIRDGSAFGNEYFEADKRGIQDGMGAYMKPAGYDRDAIIAASTLGKNAAHDSASSGMYQTWLTRTQAGDV
ncbi:MAG: hypothetical protein WC110_10615 [Bacteroidales bacterium]|jgi:hypothetical protein